VGPVAQAAVGRSHAGKPAISPPQAEPLPQHRLVLTPTLLPTLSLALTITLTLTLTLTQAPNPNPNP